MAGYKHSDASTRFLAVDLERQFLPGSFEHALRNQVDHEIDLSEFDVLSRSGGRGEMLIEHTHRA